MKTYRVLVPTDFSSGSDAALGLASTLAKEHADSQILLVHVIETSVPGYDDQLGVLEPETLRTNMQMLASSHRHQIPIEAIIAHGHPATRIVEIADQRDVDLIVISTHGRSGLAHLLMGSTAESVLRRASCPVMTIRQNPKVTTVSTS